MAEQYFTRPNIEKVIGKLGTTPEQRGLSTQEFKDKFDEMPEAIQQYIKETLLTELDAFKQDFITHLADNVSQLGGVHGLEIEKGTWTPYLVFGESSEGFEYSVQQGEYTRINNKVFVRMRLMVSNKGSNNGNLAVRDLPFSASTIFIFSSAYENLSLPSNFQSLMGATISGTNIYPRYLSTSGIRQNFTDTMINNNTEIRISGEYLI